ncbi:hypothetical protein A2U01_0093082 [Trifolium medium]|uniref:Uncharacterized protein n=1 Tax=Trifolium medium TaxID=97028 RepID=A0A392UE54_9FABA|nr:hypothetical protein [Trifolium medium]
MAQRALADAMKLMVNAMAQEAVSRLLTGKHKKLGEAEKMN